MNKRIAVDELRFGMYIAELDRPWTDTPFMFQGFVLSTQQQLDALKKYCSSVLVDVERSPVLQPAAPRIAYAERAPVEQEIGAAKSAYTGGHELVRHVIAAVRVGRALDAVQLRSAVSAMAESVLRNPDALLLFSQLRSKGEYTESHASPRTSRTRTSASSRRRTPRWKSSISRARSAPPIFACAIRISPPTPSAPASRGSG